MSAGNDNVFARWSRRKQAVRESSQPLSDAEEHVVDAIEPQADAEPREPVDRQLDPIADAGERVEPLPCLEDLTAESDLSAFLREGVPKALKSAAMRKMWSLDPAIRDYVGPSEYAWDFNQPGSMAGFGPLDGSESVAEFLSTMSGGARAGLAGVVTAPEALPEPQQVAAVSPEQEESAPPEDSADAASPDELLEPPGAPQSAPTDHATADAEPAEATGPAGSSRIFAGPRHGRAMPR